MKNTGGKNKERYKNAFEPCNTPFGPYVIWRCAVAGFASLSLSNDEERKKRRMFHIREAYRISISLSASLSLAHSLPLSLPPISLLLASREPCPHVLSALYENISLSLHLSLLKASLSISPSLLYSQLVNEHSYEG